MTRSKQRALAPALRLGVRDAERSAIALLGVLLLLVLLRHIAGS